MGYFCATPPVAVPFRLLFNDSVATGTTVPWNEYFSPPPFGPMSVIVPINCQAWVCQLRER